MDRRYFISATTSAALALANYGCAEEQSWKDTLPGGKTPVWSDVIFQGWHAGGMGGAYDNWAHVYKKPRETGRIVVTTPWYHDIFVYDDKNKTTPTRWLRVNDDEIIDSLDLRVVNDATEDRILRSLHLVRFIRAEGGPRITD